MNATQSNAIRATARKCWGEVEAAWEKEGARNAHERYLNLTRRWSMKLKMYTPDGSVIVESNLVTQFYPDTASGGELTTIETISSDGETFSVRVKHSFHQVAHALATAWSVDEKKAEGGQQ